MPKVRLASNCGFALHLIYLSYLSHRQSAASVTLRAQKAVKTEALYQTLDF